MRRVFVLMMLALAVARTPLDAATITFDEPAVTSTMTNTYAALQGLLTYSPSVTSFALGSVSFAAGGQTSGGFSSMLYFRSTFDNRTPYPYNFISGNLMQTYGTQMSLAFANPVLAFGFGAALDSTNKAGQMFVELFRQGSVVGSTVVTLQPSVRGGNSEGTFFVSGFAIDAVRITNRGDGVNQASNFNWVMDNVTYQEDLTPVPEPGSFALVSLGVLMSGVVVRVRRRRSR